MNAYDPIEVRIECGDDSDACLIARKLLGIVGTDPESLIVDATVTSGRRIFKHSNGQQGDTTVHIVTAMSNRRSFDAIRDRLDDLDIDGYALRALEQADGDTVSANRRGLVSASH